MVVVHRRARDGNSLELSCGQEVGLTVAAAQRE
jgi:hypothetical protein